MDQETEQKVYAAVATVAGVTLESVNAETALEGIDFAELEQTLQAALDLEILPAAIEGSQTVAALTAKLDEILYC